MAQLESPPTQGDWLTTDDDPSPVVIPACSKCQRPSYLWGGNSCDRCGTNAYRRPLIFLAEYSSLTKEFEIKARGKTFVSRSVLNGISSRQLPILLEALTRKLNVACRPEEAMQAVFG